MKTIIAPIDFSDVSNNALLFAAELSQRTSAQLVVVHIMQENEDEAEASKKLNLCTSFIHKSFGSDLSCESIALKGNFVSSLKGLIGLHRPDLVVMGTKGASGLKKILIGSNTVKVLANVQVPVLVIPEAARFEGFIKTGKNRIVMATDLNELNTENALDILKEIAQLMIDPLIKVISIRPENKDLDDGRRMERNALVSRFKPEITCEWATIFSNSVMGGINFYLNKHDDTGLVAMIARDTGHLVQKHYTREMASHTHYPLLVMHDG